MSNEQRPPSAKPSRMKRCSSRWTPYEADYTHRCMRRRGHPGHHFAERDMPDGTILSAEWPGRDR